MIKEAVVSIQPGRHASRRENHLPSTFPRLDPSSRKSVATWRSDPSDHRGLRWSWRGGQRRQIRLSWAAGKTRLTIARTIDAVWHPKLVAFLPLDASKRIVVRRIDRECGRESDDV